MSHDIFISYSSKDKQTADAICHTLEANKLKCWIAPRNIMAGKNYAEQIMYGIKSAKLIVLVFSKNSQESVFVNNEINTAFSNNKPIISFKIDETLPENRMGFFLKNKHWLDAYPDPESVFETLVRDAQHLCEESDFDPESVSFKFSDASEAEKTELEKKLDNNPNVIIDVEDSDNDSGNMDLIDELQSDDKSNRDLNIKFSNADEEKSSSKTVSGSSSSSKLKIPVIIIAVILILVVGFLAFGGLNLNNSGGDESSIVINYVDVSDDGESYYVFGSINYENASSDCVVHTEFCDNTGKVLKTNETKFSSITDATLCKCLVSGGNVSKVIVELRDSNGIVLASAESENIK